MAIIGKPLTPSILDTLGVLKGWPPPAEPFDPGGTWTHVYRIWTCHGYTDKGNVNRGVLEIERTPGPAKAACSLRVRQRVVHAADLVHELTAEIACRNDALATPATWSLRSRFLEPDGRERKDLSLAHEGRYENGRIERSINGRPQKPIAVQALTADWCLFEAVQRWSPNGLRLPSFDLLEGLTVLRPQHDFSARGRESLNDRGRPLSLTRFSQIGRGVLPVDYWLDADSRLLLVATHDKAFLLDPDAESKVQWRRKRRARKEA